MQHLASFSPIRGFNRHQAIVDAAADNRPLARAPSGEARRVALVSW